MPQALIVYASTHGHTAKIAAAVARAVRENGLEVEVRNVSSAAQLSPSAYDSVIVGASVHGGRHQHEIVDWAKRHHILLSGMPSAFFSVCLSAADDTAESGEATRSYIDDLGGSRPLRPRVRRDVARRLLASGPLAPPA